MPFGAKLGTAEWGHFNPHLEKEGYVRGSSPRGSASLSSSSLSSSRRECEIIRSCRWGGRISSSWKKPLIIHSLIKWVIHEHSPNSVLTSTQFLANRQTDKVALSYEARSIEALWSKKAQAWTHSEIWSQPWDESLSDSNSEAGAPSEDLRFSFISSKNHPMNSILGTYRRQGTGGNECPTN